jgi:hypothetical protein
MEQEECVTLFALDFDHAADARDFVRALRAVHGTMLAARTSASGEAVVHGLALTMPDRPVRLYATEGALALARELHLPVPPSGEAIDVSALPKSYSVLTAAP